MTTFHKGDRVRLRSIPSLVGVVVLDGVLGFSAELVCVAFDEFECGIATLSNWVTLPADLLQLDTPAGVVL